MLRILTLGLCLVLAAGCGGLNDEPDSGWVWDGDPYPPDAWDPGDRGRPACVGDGGDGCSGAAVDCAASPCVHGECRSADGGSDYCLCETGYAGLLCDRCAAGFESDGLTCIPADPCAAGPCVYGTCRPDGVGYTCDCETGYAGEHCDTCTTGYHAENLKCVRD